MASVRQNGRWKSQIGQSVPYLAEIEQWFLRQGVPQFVFGYSARDSMPVVFYLLLLVVAFDLSILPWVGSAWFLWFVPAAVLSLTLLVKVAIMDQAHHLINGMMREKDGVSRRGFGGQFRSEFSIWIRLSVLFVSAYLAGCLILLIDRTIYWSDSSVNFIVIAGLLWVSVELFRADRGNSSVATSRNRRWLYAIVLIAIVCFALEGSILPDSKVVMDRVMGSIMPGAVPVPQGFAALIVVVVILVLARGLMSESGEIDGIVAQQSNAFPVVQLSLIVFCAQVVILPYIGPVWLAVVIPFVSMVTILVLLFVYRWRQERLRRYGSKRQWRLAIRPEWLKVLLSYPGVASLIVLYLVACPLLAGILSGSDRNQIAISNSEKSADTVSVVLLAFGINLLYLGLVVGIAVFGLDRVAGWAIREAFASWHGRIFNFGRGLSLLIIFTAFYLFASDTWEFWAEIDTVSYLLLLACLLGLTGGFHMLMSIEALHRRSEFKSWSEVRKAALSDPRSHGNSETSSDLQIEALLDRPELAYLDSRDSVPSYPLRPLETVNSIVVMMTYEVLFFIPVMVSATIVFLLLGYIAVSPDAAAGWVYGDRPPPSVTERLLELPLIEQPWLRVALMLTAISIFYLAAEILSDPRKRSEYFEGPDNALRRRLAIRLAYYEVFTYHWLLPQLYVHVLRAQWDRRRFGRDPQLQGRESRGGGSAETGESHQARISGA